MNQRTLIVSMTVFLAVVLQAHFSQAVLLKQTAGTEIFEKKTLLKTATIAEDDKTEVAMSPVSHGLRKKTAFGLVTVNVYVLQLLAAKPEKLIHTEAGFLDSLKEAGPIHMNLTFLRDLSGEKISSSFKDGLEANGVQSSAMGPELTQVLKEISAIKEFKEGQTFSISVAWSGDKATVYLDGADSVAKIVSITGPEAFAKQLLSIWFGKAADSRLEDLKRALIK
jgi:hypothetical protein